MPLESRPTQTALSLENIVLFVSDMAASRSFYEHILGLRIIAADPSVTTYSAGHVQICLLPAAQHRLALREGPDRSADITFMVDDLPRCRDALAARGVRLSRTREYVVGMTADFYDPDGHWFSIWQPSEAAMRWPSGLKLEALASDLPARHSRRLSSVDAVAPHGGLADAFIAYVFLLVSDPEVAAGYYGGILGLDAIEGGPCRRVPTSAQIGVVKYDVGTTMLATHHVESADPRHLLGTGGVAMAFRVADLTTAVAALSRRGIVFSDRPSDSPIGRLARFTDPAGHVFLLREPRQKGGRSVGAGMPTIPVARK